MRSLASGGTCGDSVAAARAATMSSLRRRAMLVQRTMSTERSSIGGGARARPGPRPDQARRRKAELLGGVHEHVLEASADPRACEPQSLEDKVAGVARP